MLLITLLTASAVTADEFTWSTQSQYSRLAEGRELTVLSGGATITSDATTIVADEIELWGTDFRYSIARGNVTATDTERGLILASDTLFYDRIDDIIRVDGFIDMQDLKNDVVVRGGFFEFFGEEEIAYIQIGVRILKVDEDTELACRSEFARYRRSDEILELSGMPKVTRNDDIYTAARILINLDTDEIFLDGDVSGKLITGDETAPSPEDGAGPSAGQGADTNANPDAAPKASEEKGSGGDQQPVEPESVVAPTEPG